MKQSDHAEVESYAVKFGGTAVLGYLCTFLIVGKSLHFFLQRRGLLFGYLVFPPVLISGILGLCVFAIIHYADVALSESFATGLEGIKINLINFVFAALALGLTCSRSSSKHSNIRAIVTSLFHEGMPMIIYSQILMWGQTVCCLFVSCVGNLFGAAIPPLFTAMVPLGLEAGSDIIAKAPQYNYWSKHVVEEAESLGLITAAILAIVLLSSRSFVSSLNIFPSLYNYGSSSSGSSSSSSGSGSGMGMNSSSGSSSNSSSVGGVVVGGGHDHNIAEAFNRPRKPSVSMTTPLDFYNIAGNNNAIGGSGGGEGNLGDSVITNNGRSQMQHGVDSTATFSSSNNTGSSSSSSNSSGNEVGRTYLKIDSASSDGSMTHPVSSNEKADYLKSRQEYTSLGTHISFIALAVFLSFGVSTIARIAEIELKFGENRVFSGVRMFKLSMFFALIVMHITLRNTSLRFNRVWFMRLCGFLLDVLMIAACSSANPRPKSLDRNFLHYGWVLLFSCTCIIWNLFCFFVLAHRLFPNYWYERGLILMSDCLGHAYMGLVVARTMDPLMVTPVPAAYAYKLMLFFIPSSGGKNSIIISLVDLYGPWLALIVGICVVAAWMLIFEKFFRHRFVRAYGSSDGLSSSLLNTGEVGDDEIGERRRRKSSKGDVDDEEHGHDGSYDMEDASLLSDSGRSGAPLLGGGAGTSTGTSASGGTATPPKKTRRMVGSSASPDCTIANSAGDDDEDGGDSAGIGGKNNNNTSSGSSSGSSNSDGDAIELSSLVRSGNEATGSNNSVNNSNINTNTKGNSTSSSGISANKLPNQLYLPLPVELSEDSSILKPQHIHSLVSWLSANRTVNKWHLSYSLRRDGASVDTLMSLCASGDIRNNFSPATPSKYAGAAITCSDSNSPLSTNISHLVIVEDSWGYVFGGHIAHSMSYRPAYYGNGECFVFSLVPTMKIHSWTGKNDFFVLSNHNMLAMGGGGEGYAFQVWYSMVWYGMSLPQ